MKNTRVFLIVLDSFGIGNAPDADQFGDVGSNTLRSIIKSKEYDTPVMKELGLFNIEGVEYEEKELCPKGSFGRLQEASQGKDTTIGHWEIAGIVSHNPLPTFPHGFPKDFLNEFSKITGRGILCNQPYSGTDVIRDYGEEHEKTGDLIIYTSADSVLQIAAHEKIIPIKQLYKYCEIARAMLTGPTGVGRVIARPFIGTPPHYQRTINRHDFSLLPPKETMLDCLLNAGYETYGIGKIYDIFAGKGIKYTQKINSNEDGMNRTIQMLDQNFSGICFVNLVDFDMVYGHRNDIDGYARAATMFDRQLYTFIKGMKDNDILMITADHGCDPGYKGTDHTRECVPILTYGNNIKGNNSIGTRYSFADVGATILEIFQLPNCTDGISFQSEIRKG
ncbi:MAG: phosphopentomutase [Lachnospiraceae bacterium]